MKGKELIMEIRKEKKPLMETKKETLPNYLYEKPKSLENFFELFDIDTVTLRGYFSGHQYFIKLLSEFRDEVRSIAKKRNADLVYVNEENLELHPTDDTKTSSWLVTGMAEFYRRKDTTRRLKWN